MRVTRAPNLGSERAAFSKSLLAWYGRNKRDLPWRKRQQDPYAVWVSEIMLQQTTVAAVIPFYGRWMARFPTVQALAEAPLDDALKHWAGLGYYARARNLHRGAQLVVAQHGGEVPSEPKALLALPGIGRYTAGAILSIAFNQDAPILDANVVRVLSRVHMVIGDPKTDRRTQDALWKLAEAAIPKGAARDFNQALMELGALVCGAAAPKCGSCPVTEFCAARAEGDPTAFPRFATTKKWLEVEEVSVAVRDAEQRVLIVQRSPALSLWGGLWEMPRATMQEEEPLAICAARAVREAIGFEPLSLEPYATTKHVVANRKITLHGFQAAVANPSVSLAPQYVQFAWEPLIALSRYAMASPQVRLAEELAAEAQQARLEL